MQSLIEFHIDNLGGYIHALIRRRHRTQLWVLCLTERGQHYSRKAHLKHNDCFVTLQKSGNHFLGVGALFSVRSGQVPGSSMWASTLRTAQRQLLQGLAQVRRTARRYLWVGWVCVLHELPDDIAHLENIPSSNISQSQLQVITESWKRTNYCIYYFNENLTLLNSTFYCSSRVTNIHVLYHFHLKKRQYTKSRVDNLLA